jgi:hypothetical protein
VKDSTQIQDGIFDLVLGKSPKRCFIVYDNKTFGLQQALEIIETGLQCRAINYAMFEADRILHEELDYDSQTPKSSMRIISGFQKVPFLNEFYLREMVKLNQIQAEADKTSEYRRKGGKTIFNCFVECLEVIDQQMRNILIQDINIPPTFIQRFRGITPAKAEVRHSYTQGCKHLSRNNTANGFRFVMLCMAYRYFERLIGAGRPTHTTFYIIDEVTFGYLRRFNADNLRLLADNKIFELSGKNSTMPASSTIDKLKMFVSN